MADEIRVELHFQAGGFSSDEIEEYRSSFDDLGEARAETYDQPAAGSAFGLAIIIKFVASAVAGGVIYDVLKKVGGKLLRVWQRRKDRKKHPPETSYIQLEFKDITIVLGNDDRGRFSPDEYSIHRSVAEKLATLVEQITAHLTAAPLKDAQFQFLHVPVLAAQDGSDQPLIKRNWKLTKARYEKYGVGTITIPQIR